MDFEKLANKSILPIRPYVPGKSVKQALREMDLPQVYKMASNENPRGASTRARARYKELADMLHIYPEIHNQELLSLFAEKLGCSPDNIVFSNGGDGIIYSMGMAVLNPGDETIIPEITFSVYETITRIMHGVPVFSPMKDDSIDLDDIYSRITDKTKIIFVCNPNNPTGQCLDPERLKAFLRKVPENIFVFLDEAYIDFTEPGLNPDSIGLINGGMRNLFVLRTFSKVYGLAGVRMGYGVGDKELISLISRVKPPFDVSIIAENLASEALLDTEFYEETVNDTAREKEYYYSELDMMGLRYFKSQTNYILIDTGMDCRKVADALMRHGIIVRPAASYGFPTCIRITVGLHKENMLFFDALKKVLG
ncbi:MAG: histidinol-phosphate transaminase [Spirochaetia bacterium]|nr:histidinol-phosphate transaminase [Spirochaetia bacterium]